MARLLLFNTTRKAKFSFSTWTFIHRQSFHFDSEDIHSTKLPETQEADVRADTAWLMDDNWMPFERLALMTVRLFYNLPEYYVMKAILTAPRQLRGSNLHPELQLDDTIAERLRMTIRYVRSLLAKLKADGLVIEVAPQAKKLYGIDFEILADSVTFKLDAMDRRLKDQQAPKLHTYRCPKCGLRQSELVVDYNTQLNPMTGGLSCPSGNLECFGIELAEENNSDARVIVEAHRNALSIHLSGLQRALRDVADLPPPTYKRPRIDDAESAAAAAKAGKSGSGARAGASGSSAGGGGATTLGASRGIAAGGSSQPLPSWMLSNAQQAAALALAAQAATQPPAKEMEQAAADALAEEEFVHFMKLAANASSREGPSSLAAPSLAPLSAPSGAIGAAVNRAAMHATQPVAAESAGAEDGEEDDDPEVFVQGQPMALSEVTEADIERMSDEEHRRYYALYQSLVA